MQQPGRLRLRPWLEEQLHSGKYPGVSWLDQSAQIFQIPWKHAARHGWSIDKDATLFRSWAMHTGRYHPGKDKPDPKTWKANFRCALNSLSDICELQEHSRKRGSNAYRVYKMLPTSQPQRRRRGLRLLSRPRERLTSSGAHTHDAAWFSTTTRPVSDAPQQVATAAQDTINSMQAHGMWETKSDEQEQNEAVFKLMDHLSSSEQWSHAGEQRGWRAQTLWDHWHCGVGDDNPCPLHSENYTDLFGASYIKEFSDCSVQQQH